MSARQDASVIACAVVIMAISALVGLTCALVPGGGGFEHGAALGGFLAAGSLLVNSSARVLHDVRARNRALIEWAQDLDDDGPPPGDLR